MSRARRSLLVLAASVLFALLGAATAQADTFCLNSPTCGGANNYPMTRDGLAQALLDAQNTAEDSIVEIGSGTIEIDTPVAVAANAINKVSIEGVGTSGRPVLHFTHPTGAGFTFTGSGTLPGGISYVDVQIDAQNASRTALSVQDGRVYQVNFDVAAQNFAGTGGASLTNNAECVFCNFSLHGSSASGVATFSSATVKRSTFINSGLSTDTTSGIIALPGAFVNVFSSRFSGLSVAVNVASGTVGLNDSVIDLRSRTGARGVDVDNPSASGTGSRVANLDGVTVVGTGDSQLGLRVAAETSNAAGENATGVARNSLFLLTGAGSTDLYCAQGASNASSQLNMFNSLVRVSAPLLTGSCGNSQSGNLPSDIPGSEVQASDLFVNSAGGDLRLRKGAIVIDQGVAANDASLAGRGFDAYGYLRVIGSNVDMGGSEYENHEPARPTLTPSATTTVAGTAIDFSADASDPNGDALTYDWNFGDGTVANGKTTSHTFTQPGTYTVSVAASDFDLQGSAAEVLITVTAPPSTGGGGGGTTLPIPEAVLSFTKPTCKFKSPKKTKNGFTVNAAKVKDCYIQQRSSAAHSYMFRLERTAAGYMIGGTCKAKQGKTGSAKRCNLPLKGSQLIEIPAETSYLTFGGKWNKKTLPSGKYTVVAVNPNTPTSKITVNLIYKAKQGSTGRTK